MNEAAWNRVKRIFHEAMARPPASRYAFLDEVCSGEAGIRAEVEELLAAHDDLRDPDTASSQTGRVEAPGAVIGRYKLLQRIGEGGFGVVYMAEQQEPVQRRVALKIIKPGMDTKQVVARFESERQALAMMEHPGIAKVLDAGATEAGRPYFVMELVKGLPITDYCDANNLGTLERLRLFVETCHAVQHAHQKGIIHRDIKPSNVMVTLHDGKPVPKVIDFGVAKATQQRLTEKTLFTAYGQIIGTPAYMSPEQAEMSALDVDTRSDVYSLGVLLYELLVGTTPFDPDSLRSAAYDEIQRMLKEVEPPKPSTRLSTLGDAAAEVARRRQAEPQALARMIRGDLDWIAMKALEKDRARRYASASELAGDVTRHLESEPVVARPPGTLYRVGRLARKHRGPVAAAMAIIATIVVLGSVALWQGRVAREQARRIRQQSMQVRAASVLATAAAADDPAVRALLLTELGETFELAGRLRVARDVANMPLPRVILRGHPDGVDDVAFSPDGNRIATASADGARIWNAEGTGPPVLLPHDAKVTSVAFDPEGRLLTSSGDGIARLWPVGGIGQPIEFPGSLPVLDPDGRLVATAAGSTVSLWRTDGAGRVRTLAADVGVSALVIVSGGTRIITGHDDGTTRLWPTDGNGRPVVLRGHDGRVTAAALAHGDADGFPLATYGDDGTLRQWALDGSGRSKVFRRQDFVKGDRELPKWHERGSDRSVIFAGPLAGLVRASHAGSTLAFHWERQLVVDGYREYAARVFGSGVSGDSLVLRGGRGQVLAAAFDADGRRLVTGHADGTARVWSLPGEEPRILGCMNDFAGCLAMVRGRPIGGRIENTDAALSPDGELVATSWADGGARIQRTDGTGRAIVLDGHTEEVSSIAFGPDGERVMTSSLDGTVKIWRVDGVGEPLELRHARGVVDAVFSPDGGRVATASREDNRAWIWSADGKGEPVVLRAPRSEIPILSVAFSPDGDRLVTGGPGETAWVWRSDGIGEPIPLEGHGQIRDVAFGPDGSRVALGCEDGEVRIWNADGSGEPLVIYDHLDDVSGVAFSPDGTRLASASEDGTIRIRWLDGSRETLVLRGHKYPVRRVGFSRDGRRVVSAGADGTARIWRVTWAELVDYFDNSVRTCLTPDDRQRYLAESRVESEQAFSACEQRHGR